MSVSTYTLWKPVIKSAGIATFNRVFAILIRFFTVPILLNYLGGERYGLWLTIYSMSAYVILFDFGIASAMVNDLTCMYANNARDDANSQITNRFVFLSCVSLLIASIMFPVIGSIDVAHLFKLSTDAAKSEALSSTIVAFSMFFFQLPLSFILRVPYTMQKGAITEVALFVGNVISATGLIYAILAGKGLPSIVFFLSGATVFSSLGLLMFLLITKEIRPVNLSLGDLRSNIKCIRGRTYHFIIMQCIWTLLNTLPYSMLSLYLGAKAVVSFGLMTQIMLTIQTPVIAIMQPLWTRIVEIISTNRNDLLKKLLYQYFQLTSLYSIFAMLLLIFAVNPILAMLLHIDLYISLEMRIVFAIWCSCGLIAGGGLSAILLAMGETIFLSRLCITQFIIYCICSSILMPAMEGVGIVISLIASYLIIIPAIIRVFRNKYNLNTSYSPSGAP